MPPVTPDTASAVGERAARRLAALDPLLPAPAVPAGCGAELAVTGPDGSTAALGTCEHWAGEPGSLDLAWGAARRFRLEPQVAAVDVRGALDRLLTGWREHLAAVPGTGEDDTAAVVPWPSRDIAGHRASAAGPRAGSAGRHRGPPGRTRRAGAGVPPGPGLRIRPAGPADLDRRGRAGHGDDPVRRELRHGHRAAGQRGRAAR